jgi:hypothetical protein
MIYKENYLYVFFLVDLSNTLLLDPLLSKLSHDVPHCICGYVYPSLLCVGFTCLSIYLTYFNKKNPFGYSIIGL